MQTLVVIYFVIGSVTALIRYGVTESCNDLAYTYTMFCWPVVWAKCLTRLIGQVNHHVVRYLDREGNPL